MNAARVILFCALFGLVLSECNKACQRPASYSTFTRLNLEDVRREIRYYFPSAPISPPSIFTSDATAIPSMKFNRVGNLSVTFMFEGAGNRNQLGYFTYTKGTNGQIQNVVHNLLFPDINEVTDGSCVFTGMTVTAGPIAAGTFFGFYLVSDGYCGQSQTFYSISSLNTPNDANVRHVGMYLDYFRELLIIGFEDLLRSGWDNDFEDTMFIFDTSGVDIQYDGLPYACTNTPCYNGGVCNYTTGECNCSRTKYGGRSCSVCSCADQNGCGRNCIGNQCIPTNYQSDIGSCLNQQSCGTQATCFTTGVATTGIPTTGVRPTTGSVTTGEIRTTGTTTGAGTTGIAPTVATTGRATTGAANTVVTTGVVTTAVPTTAVGTTGHITTGEGFTSNTNVKPTNTLSISEGDIPTISSDDKINSAVLIGAFSACFLALLF